MTPGSCPKCKAPRDAQSQKPCAKCGLAADRMADFAEKREANIPEVLATQWAKTLAAWDDQSVHDELLRLVAQHDTYAWGAARYRDIEEARPGDRIAKQQLERLRRAAEINLMATATRRESDATSSAYRSTKAVLALLIVCVLALMIYAWLTKQKPPPDPTLVPPVPAAPEQVR